AALASVPTGRGSCTSGAAAAAARSALNTSSGAVAGCGALVPRERRPPTTASSSTSSRTGPADRGPLPRPGGEGSRVTSSSRVLDMGPVYAAEDDDGSRSGLY